MRHDVESTLGTMCMLIRVLLESVLIRWCVLSNSFILFATMIMVCRYDVVLASVVMTLVAPMSLYSIMLGGMLTLISV